MALSEIVTTYWPFVVSIAGLAFGSIFAWANAKRDIKGFHETLVDFKQESINDRAEIRNIISKQEAKYESIQPVLLAIQKDLVELKTIMRVHFKEI